MTRWPLTSDHDAVTRKDQLLAKRHRFGYESKDQALISRSAFAKRLARSFAAASLIVGISLAVGMAGYHYFENLEWIDAFADASMILSGMGPLTQPKTWGGKLFAGLYALYSGLALLGATTIILAPIVHRLLHHFHVESSSKE
jgi:hypothetical protein